MGINHCLFLLKIIKYYNYSDFITWLVGAGGLEVCVCPDSLRQLGTEDCGPLMTIQCYSIDYTYSRATPPFHHQFSALNDDEGREEYPGRRGETERETVN